MIRLSLVALAAGALALAGCTKKDDVPQNTNTSADPAAGPSNDHVGQFLTNAIASDLGEIKLGQMAGTKASAQGVRDLAQALVRDHGNSKDQAEQLARAHAAQIPTDPRSDALSEIDKLNSLSGTDFDREFASFMVKDHQRTINSFQAEAGSSDPQDVTSFAQQALPALKQHLQMAESLATGLNGKGS